MAGEEDAILAWTDEETSGLTLDDHVLEVAVVFTDTDLNELGSFETLVRPQPSTFARILADPIVSDMHRKSGLLSALRAGGDDLPTVDEAEAALLAAIDQVARPGQMVMMAGGGVSHFDIGHLGRWMPAFGNRLHYGTVDISDVVRGYISATGNCDTFAKSPVKAHRAMADVREELEIAPLIWDMFQQYDSRRFAGVKSTPAERVLAGASLIQAASVQETDRELTTILDELSARDAVAGVTVVATKLLQMLATSSGRSSAAILDEVRMGAVR
ncbi:hypothetical protein [Microbacterium hominis]|uniref:Exonuclease domain-containing protein n=2 Tax=Microbacterium TaxID=33882 RepID=A0A2K9DY32_9MICO|nr:hypothetical protein [Microbacterium hominis]AUG29553.1 hypothetical protein CXR34_08895 [Microbacterium hominis]